MSDNKEKESISLEEIDCQYRETSAILLARIAERDEMKSLLKIARPEKLVPLRDVIAGFDNLIEKIEQELEMINNMRRKRIALDESIEKLAATMEKIKPEPLAHIAKHHPEKFEAVKIFLSDEYSGKTH